MHILIAKENPKKLLSGTKRASGDQPNSQLPSWQSKVKNLRNKEINRMDDTLDSFREMQKKKNTGSILLYKHLKTWTEILVE